MKKFLKAFGIIVLAAVLVAGGYYMGTQAGEHSIVSALPHRTLEQGVASIKPDATGAPEQAESDGPVEKADEKPKNESDTNTATEPEKTGRTVVKTDESAAGETWSNLEEYSCDLFGNDTDAKIVLYTSAQREGDEIIWDDGQNWVVEISDGDGGYYTLLDKYINNGNVYFEVSELENGQKAVNIYLKTGAGFEVKQYTYGENGFVEKTLYNLGTVNTMYSSIPDYQ